MFILRTVFTYSQGEGVKEMSNVSLGDAYNVYYEESYYFKEEAKQRNLKDSFAIIIAKDKRIDLLCNTTYYIMTEDGKTFERLRSDPK